MKFDVPIIDSGVTGTALRFIVSPKQVAGIWYHKPRGISVALRPLILNRSLNRLLVFLLPDSKEAMNAPYEFASRSRHWKILN